MSRQLIVRNTIQYKQLLGDAAQGYDWFERDRTQFRDNGLRIFRLMFNGLVEINHFFSSLY